jgi:flagellar motility protein MotE (MotC chaperone)
MTSNPLVKSAGQAIAIVVIFTMTFAALFMRSKTVFSKILAQQQSVKHVMTKAELESTEHKQFVYWNFRTTEINKMIKDLAEEREALKGREAELSSVEARVTSERKENERIRDEIERSKKELSGYIVQIKSGETARLKEEVTILSNMAPESIVSVLSEKSDEEAVKILAQMKPDMVAQILESMMAQPAGDGTTVSPKKRAANLLETLKRLRGEETAQKK